MEANNMAASREALSEIVLLTVKAGVSISCDVACGIIASKAKHALKQPPRNCDVGTAEEQVKRFTIFCKSQRLHSPGHADFCNPKCPCRDGGDINLCALTWAQMPYEERKGDEP